ncbi:MAG: hypothetical protein M3O01_13275 [Pseudomonadota bacterium]|nr:hypothetical protein [Pseudomonadota bacterium]
MDLSKYDAPADAEPAELKAKYFALRKRLEDLLSAPEKDMVAVDATIVELDEVHASFKNSQTRAGDPQRF